MKPLTAFTPDRTGAQGVTGRCKECRAEAMRKRRGPSTRRVLTPEERAEALRRRDRRRYAANPEKYRKRYKAWVAANPETARAVARAAGARHRGARVEGDLTAEQWAEIVAEFNGLCAWCEERPGVEQDHVIPIVRGGRHTASNVVPACRKCNASKGGRLPCEWLGFAEPGRAA